MSTNFDQTAVMFREWSIIEDSVKRFPQVLKDAHRINPKARFKCFMVGSPRNAMIVCGIKVNKVEYFKHIRVDIRSGSCECWLEQFDATEWIIKKI